MPKVEIGGPMPRYLIRARYTAEGMKGLVKEGGTSRKAAVAKAFAGADGKLEAFYYGFGSDDAYVIGQLPDNVAAAGLSLAIAATGAVTLRTVVLLEPEDIDKATKKAVTYRAPGQP
jgi:uncharacterized protein with GYD domain